MFLLVTEGLVKKHQRALADEMETTVSELIARAEQGLTALQKKEAHLQTKVCALIGSLYGYLWVYSARQRED